jgi:hypothetical protein
LAGINSAVAPVAQGSFFSSTLGESANAHNRVEIPAHGVYCLAKGGALVEKVPPGIHAAPFSALQAVLLTGR